MTRNCEIPEFFASAASHSFGFRRFAAFIDRQAELSVPFSSAGGMGAAPPAHWQPQPMPWALPQPESLAASKAGKSTLFSRWMWLMRSSVNPEMPA